MKFVLPDGQELSLKPLTDEEFDRVRILSTRPLNVCPTCGGRDEVMPDSGGVRVWQSSGYQFRGEHRECNCKAQLALFQRYILANIGDQYQRLDWREFAGTPEAFDRVNSYVANWQSYLAHGYGLTFASKRQGVGKTWAATHIGKQLIKQRQRVYFQDFVQMVDAFCGDREDKRTVEARMKDTTFLIMDDVLAGISERQTDLYALKFEVVIRHRTNYNLPTIFTTNLTEAQFEKEFPRIYSLIHPKQEWVAMNGLDHRKLRDTAVETAEMILNGEVSPIT